MKKHGQFERRLSGTGGRAGASQVSGNPTTRLQVALLPIVAVSALGGLGLGAVALSHDPSTSSLQRQVNGLQAELVNDRAAITTLEASTAHTATASNVSQIKGNMSQIKGNMSQIKGNVSQIQGSVSGIEGNVTRLQNQLHGFTLCIPQLHQEVTGLNIQGSTRGGFIRTAFIQDPTIISQDCSKLISGR
jgi:hypothetical protein